LGTDSGSGPGATVPEEALSGLVGDAGEILRRQIRTIWSRSGLTLEERALLTLAGDACMGSLGEVFAAHLRLARAVGASEERVRSVLCFVGEYGFGRSVAALEALDRWGLTAP
jgi:alkylhydroperoxidase/carboxymuconolactone decarboxylase family protein YurZ